MCKDPTFLLGHPRSGTSLVAAMLDRHSKIAVPPETSFFFCDAVNKWRNIRSPHKFSHEELWSALPLPLKNMQGANDFALPKFKDLKPHPKHLLESLMEGYAATKNKFRWAEKSPWHIRHVDTIYDWFPDAKVVAIVRDGRDCVRSCLQVPFQSRNWFWYAMTWSYTAELAIRLKKKYGSNFFILYYEDIIQHPRSTILELDEFLNLNYESCQLNSSMATSSFAEETEPWKQRVNKSLDPNRVYAWKNTLSAKQKNFYNFLMHDQLVAHGYPDCEVQPSTLPMRLQYNLVRFCYTFMLHTVLSIKKLTGRL